MKLDELLNNYKIFSNVMIDNTYEYIYEFINRFVINNNLKYIDINELTTKINKSLPRNITAEEFYNYVADQTIIKTSYNPEYNKLASYILIEKIHKMTEENIINIAEILYNNIDIKGNKSPLISNELYNIIMKNGEEIQKVIKMERDYDIDYFGIKTLELSYLIKIRDKKSITKGKIIIERPQHMYMRVALAIHGNDLIAAYETYNLLTQKYFTHATPTLFNAGTLNQQMSSCYLISCDDNIESICKTMTQSVHISKWAGGIGIHLTAVRPKGSIIRGTNGETVGIIPYCIVLNNLSRYVNQGGKRNGSIACYIEPWHGDIFEFCELRKNTGKDDIRARDLFLALWIPDIFMERVRDNKMWSLMCSDECSDLSIKYGDEFNKSYIKYEIEGKIIKQIPARELWKHILECQIETGFPYMLYKDHANKKSNQNNLGTIKSSNLCAEIIEYSNDEETAVCFTADTLILTKKGYKKIIDCDKEQIYTYFTSDTEFIKNPKYEEGKVISNGIKKIYNIRFNNKSIKLTATHPILTYSENNEFKWKKVNELLLDDKIFAPILNNESKLNTIYCPKLNELITIQSITVEKEEEVYDIVLKQAHNFVANGIIVHNCNLVSICLPKFIETENGIKKYNFEKLIEISRIAVRNLNKIIDKNFYPTKETKNSNMKHRPIGIGVQGLADVYNILGYPWSSDNAREINKRIFETIYYACIDESNKLAKEHGYYSSFKGSHFSKGEFQFDLWKLNSNELLMNFDWDTLRKNVIQYGTYNSLLTALMPTASTSQIMGNYESFEPYMSNIFVRTTSAGEFLVINEHLIHDLEKLQLWNDDIRKLIIINNGSIQNINNIPIHLKEIYKTALEIGLKNVIKQSIERGPFIDQSQSMNLFMKIPDFTVLTSAHFYGWENGLKTGMYYLRGYSAVNPINFGIDIEDIKRLTSSNNIVDIINSSYNIDNNKKICKIKFGEKIEGCLICGS